MAARRSSSALSVTEKIALYVALGTGLLALWNDGREAYREWNSRPEVTASSATPLRMKYEPGTRTVTFSFGLVLHNEGTKAETIRTAQAQLAVWNDTNRHYDFNWPDIVMKEGTAVIPKNVPIGKDITRSVICEVSSLLNDDLRSVLQQKESRRTFELLLTGIKKDEYFVTFRFDVSAGVLAYVLDPKATTARMVEFIDSDLKSTP